MFEILRTWVSLQRSQWLERDRLAKIQNLKLKRIVDHAYRKVPFYSNLYRSHGIDPVAIHGISDLSKLPPITRRDLQRKPLEKRTAIDADLNS